MILVDSSVWIDFFSNRPTPQSDRLDRKLGRESFVVGDLILAAVLQGFKHDSGFAEARCQFGKFEHLVIGATELAIEAARNHRRLSAL